MKYDDIRIILIKIKKIWIKIFCYLCYLFYTLTLKYYLSIIRQYKKYSKIKVQLCSFLLMIMINHKQPNKLLKHLIKLNLKDTFLLPLIKMTVMDFLIDYLNILVWILLMFQLFFLWDKMLKNISLINNRLHQII